MNDERIGLFDDRLPATVTAVRITHYIYRPSHTYIDVFFSLDNGRGILFSARQDPEEYGSCLALLGARILQVEWGSDSSEESVWLKLRSDNAIGYEMFPIKNLCGYGVGPNHVEGQLTQHRGKGY
jgi:hypothetical protein